jgi:putative hydrolase of the HAD superfamily
MTGMTARGIRNVIFDFGGVLVQWQPQHIIDTFYSDESLRQRARQLVFQHPDWLDMDRGTLDESRAIERFAQRMGRPLEELAGLLEHVKESLTLLPASVALVRDLSRRGLVLYGLSNMSVPTFAHLRSRYDVWQLFRGIVISGDVRMVKPEPEIFEHIARLHGLAPAQTAFIDDHASNVEAAAVLGFRAVRFTDAATCAAELEELIA